MTTVRRHLATPSARGAAHLPALQAVLHRSAQVEAMVEECVEEISSINAVLKEEISPRHSSSDAEQALAQSEQVKEKIGQCVEELHYVNAALAQEMRERRKSERALAGLQVRLIGAQIDLLEVQSELTRVNEEREKARYFAFHDALTGLANPNLFNDRLEHALAHAKRYQQALTVMCIDVEKFSAIDDSRRCDSGDKVLQAIGERLHSSVRAVDTVGRHEGGQFLFLAEQSSAEPIARKLIAAITQPLEIEGMKLGVTASVGIATYPRDGDTAEALLGNADTAMHDAKRSAGGYAFFNRRYL